MDSLSQNNLQKFRGQEFNFQIQNFKELEKTHLIPSKQCLYVLDGLHAEVLFSLGIQAMLGYTEEEFNMGNISNKIHPEDKLIVLRIIKNTLAQADKANFKNKNAYLIKAFRIKRSDGSYIKVISKSSPFQINDLGKPLSYLTTLSDISFLQTKDVVEWEVFSDDLDVSIFKNKIYNQYLEIFSKRELEIIRLIKNQVSSNQIALKLHLSPHTVISHRKNIFKKTNCHSVNELITFCHNNGVI